MRRATNWPLSLPYTGAQCRMTLTVNLAFTRQDKAASHYHYVPFDVPVGTTRIGVDISFKRTEDCQLDFGLLDHQDRHGTAVPESAARPAQRQAFATKFAQEMTQAQQDWLKHHH